MTLNAIFFLGTLPSNCFNIIYGTAMAKINKTTIAYEETSPEPAKVTSKRREKKNNGLFQSLFEIRRINMKTYGRTA